MPIDANRIRDDIEQIARFTQTPGRGATRPTFSDEWAAAREYVIRHAQLAGCSIRIDAVGNVFARPSSLAPGARVWLCGSHLDTVPHGGDYDGVAGVICALEILRSAQDEHRILPMELVIFSEEEGTTFGLGMIGSRAAVGELTSFQLAKFFNSHGQNYLEAGRRHGVKADFIETDRLDSSKYLGFIELHIEQGPGMWRRDQRVAVVNSIAARLQYMVSITGEANNAGATSMRDRRDALAGAAEVVTALESYVSGVSDQAVVTVGRFNVSPNALNVIAQRVDFTVDFRSPDTDQLRRGDHRIEQIIQDIVARRSLDVEIIRTESIDAQPMNPKLIESLSGSEKLPIVMSGALHDAAVLARHLPTAMLFVPSRDGVSHNPNEFSRIEDIAQATRHIDKLVRRTTLADLNGSDETRFVQVCGPLFEHSPWIASRAWKHRPFESLEQLHRTMLDVVNQSSMDEKLGLIRAHPDLVGRLAREGRLTSESTHEQMSAGLDSLSSQEIEKFERFNAEYRDKFGFPFIICARENRKDSILAAFPIRLRNDSAAEIETALREIGKIAHLRLKDAVWE